MIFARQFGAMFKIIVAVALVVCASSAMAQVGPPIGPGSTGGPGTSIGGSAFYSTNGSSPRSAADRAADAINPRDFCSVCGDGNSHTVASVLGVTTLAGLAAYTANGKTPFSFVNTDSNFGVRFNLSPNVQALSGDTTLTFKTTATIGTQVPVNTTAGFGAGSVVVGDIAVTGDQTAIVNGTELSATGIQAGTTVNGAPVLASNHYTLTLSAVTTGSLAAASYITAYVTPASGAVTLPVIIAAGTGINQGDTITDTGSCIAAGTQVEYYNPAKGEVRLSKPTVLQCPAKDTLTFIPSWLSNVSNGATVLGPVGSVANGTTVSGINTSTGVVTLSGALTGAVAANAQILNNNPSTTLSGSLSGSAATMTVSSASGWPSAGTYLAQIVQGNTHETVQITAGQGTTTWTIARGTSPQTFTSGATVTYPYKQHITFSRKFTDGEAASLEMDGLALQASITYLGSASGSVTIPNQTTWRTSFPLVLPLKSQYGQTQATTSIGGYGDSDFSTTIQPVSDFGPGTAAISCGDPTAKYDNARGEYSGLISGLNWCNGVLHDVYVTPLGYSFTQGYRPTISGVPVAMDGIKAGNRLDFDHVRFTGFNNNILAVVDHTRWKDTWGYYSMCAVRFDTLQDGLFGDQIIDHMEVSGNTLSGICVNPDSYFNGKIDKLYSGTSAYMVFCEGSRPIKNCLQGVTVTNISTENNGCGVIQDGGIQDGFYAAGGNRIIKGYRDTNGFYTNAVNGWGASVLSGECQWHSYIDMGYGYDVKFEQVGTSGFDPVANAYAYIARFIRIDEFVQTGLGGFTMSGEGVATVLSNALAQNQNIVDGSNGSSGTFWFGGQWRYITLETPAWKARPIPFNDSAATSLPLGALVEWSTTGTGAYATVQRGGKTAGATFAGVSLQNWVSNPGTANMMPIIAFSGNSVPFLTTGSATIGQQVIVDVANLGQAAGAGAFVGSPPPIGILYKAGTAGVNYGTILLGPSPWAGNTTSVVSTSQLSKTSDTALATVTGLTLSLQGNSKYTCFGHLAGSANASGGIKVSLVATDTLTATSVRSTGVLYNAATVAANTTVTALGSNIAALTGAYTDLFFDAGIQTNASGTLAVQAAQNASFGTATTVNVNSTLTCTKN